MFLLENSLMYVPTTYMLKICKLDFEKTEIYYLLRIRKNVLYNLLDMMLYYLQVLPILLQIYFDRDKITIW